MVSRDEEGGRGREGDADAPGGVDDRVLADPEGDQEGDALQD